MRPLLQPRHRSLAVETKVLRAGIGDEVGGRVPALVREFWRKGSGLSTAIQQNGHSEMERGHEKLGLAGVIKKEGGSTWLATLFV